MPANVGANAIAAARFGSAAVSRLYQGSTLVWSAGAVDDFPYGQVRFDGYRSVVKAQQNRSGHRWWNRRNLPVPLISPDSPIIGGMTRNMTATSQQARRHRVADRTFMQTPRRHEAVFDTGGSGGSFTRSPAAQDGIRSQTISSFADARSGSSLTTGWTIIGHESENVGGDDTWTFYEYVVGFDLATVTGTTVSAATLRLNLSSDFSTTDFTIEARTSAYGASIGTEDFIAGASLGSATLLASIATSGIGSAGYKSLTESGTALRDAITTARAGDNVLRVIVTSSRQRTETSITLPATEYVTVDGTTPFQLDITTM